MRYSSTFELFPRYSAGSPAMVHDERDVRRVIGHEKLMHEASLEGVHGPEQQEKAQRYGLNAVVLQRLGDHHFKDLITETEYKDFPYYALRYPENLVVWTKKGEERYFFRLQRLVTLPVNKNEGVNQIKVARLLAEAVKADAWGDAIRRLWDNRLKAS